MRRKALRLLRIFFVSSYAPRRCGIATFASDLVRALSQIDGKTPGQNKALRVVALTDTPQGYNYPREVSFEINDQKRPDYRKAAQFLNVSDAQVVFLQHEFGIFGGENGAYILDLLGRLEKPVITTLHNVPKEPQQNQYDTLRAICHHSTFVVVLTKKTLDFLKNAYGIPRKKILVIPHGAPDVPFFDPCGYKAQIQAGGRPLILTFGLITPNKGIEVAIEAMVQVARELPEALYLVVGSTHPRFLRQFGEEYRRYLEKRVSQHGLEKQVLFHNEFFSYPTLITYLAAADIYLTPYRSVDQVSSGTLTQALACGKAIVSTPYRYAQELLDNDRGCLVPFGDAKAMAEEIIYLLKNKSKRDSLRRRAYRFGRRMIWPRVARAYLDVCKKALWAKREAAARDRPDKQMHLAHRI